ncbi:MAG: YlbF family regulator [Bacillota bacterium]
MSNVYNDIHKLAFALKTSDEFLALSACKKALEFDETAKKMVQDFMEKQMELQIAAMSGKQEENKAKIEQAQKLYEIISLNNNAREYLNSMMKFDRIMQDMYKIINDTIKEGMDLLDGSEKEGTDLLENAEA